MKYTVALAGNPNCGKTTLFNELTGSRQHVGNWPGVTVDRKEGEYKKNRDIHILDLPGTYSLSPYSAEETIARDYIVKERPDAVIDIVDGTAIERNLYLSLQILETGVPTVIAVNMMDEVRASGGDIDCARLSAELGVPVVPVVAREGRGIDELMTAVIDVIEKKQTPPQKKLYEPSDSEDVIADKRYTYIAQVVQKAVKKAAARKETRSDRADRILTNRWLALPIFAVIMYIMFACTFSEDSFLFIPGLQSPGVWLAGLVETVWGWLTDITANALIAAGAADWAYGLVIDGIFGGIGGILSFMPLVLVLYLLMSFLEDSGYMARVAFVMDRIFRRFGLSGKAFIPFLMSFGCGVPALMATRTLESEKDRRIAAVITTFMPCGAKLPILAMFVATFFAGSNQTLVMFSLYFLAIVVAILVSLFLNVVVYKSETSSFLMELPQYRMPTLRSVVYHAWEKVKGFGKKAGSIILVSTILIWVLSNFNINSFNGVNKAQSQVLAADGSVEQAGTVMCSMDDSFLASLGGVIAPVFKPLGFGEWRPAVGIVTGWIAKEMVVVTFSQLYADDVTPEYLADFFAPYAPAELEELGFEGGVYDEETAAAVYSETILAEGGDSNALPSMHNDIQTKGAAYAYIMFNIFCMPCFAAVGAMRRELQTWGRTAKAVGIQMAVAYIVALLCNVVGMIIA
ncbi:MAG TPA: ferrous iron transport protein B [Candidatus Treponema faecavium]|nr:ferrous iron transport protein B [Candidatus Treponema faecavium]